MSGHRKWSDVKAERALYKQLKEEFLDKVRDADLHQYIILPVVDDMSAPVSDHDQCCHVCWTQKAVLDMNTGVFHPCWTCQKKGWRLAKRSSWATWLKRNSETLIFFLGVSVVVIIVLFSLGVL